MIENGEDMTRSIIVPLMLLLLLIPPAFPQAKSNQGVVEIPFEFFRNEIILQVKVAGKGPFDMMLDTGTDPSAVDLATARELGLKLEPTGKPGTGGGTEKNMVYVTKLPLVEVGTISVKSIDAAGIDLSKISARLGKPLHGVLGHSFLRGRVVQIDYPKQVVRFYPESFLKKADAQSNTSKRTILSFRYDDNVLIDDVSINGTKVVGNVDTGSNGSFNVTPAAVTKLGLDEEVNRAKVVTGVGYNGAAENKEGKVSNVTIGAISIDNPAVIFFAKGAGRDKEPWGINIGNVFLKDFVMTIDYPRKLIALEQP